jgi:integrase
MRGGSWFHKHVESAGLPAGCSLHGLRKARASDLAEKGFSTLQIGAWTGHATSAEIDRYTRKANRRRMLEGPEQERNSGKRVLPFSKNPNEIKG